MHQHQLTTHRPLLARRRITFHSFFLTAIQNNPFGSTRSYTLLSAMVSLHTSASSPPPTPRPSSLKKQKILLMGRPNSGKTSMRRIIFSNLSPSATRSLGATISIDRSDHGFLGQLWLEIWDCAGQSGYMDNHLDGQENGGNIFDDVAALVYVFDVESRGFGIPQKRKEKKKGGGSLEEGVDGQGTVDGTGRQNPTSPTRRHSSTTSPLDSDSDSGYSSDEYSTTDLFAGPSGEDLRNFALVVARLKEYCPKAHIFTLIHKMDLVTYSARETVLQERQLAIKRVVAHVTNYLLKRGKLGCHVRHKYDPDTNNKTHSNPIPSSHSIPHPPTTPRSDPTSPLTILPTSIWDPSLYHAWSTITSHLLPPLPLLTTYLHHLASSLPRFEEILVFEATTWLKVLGITSDFGGMNPEKGRGERVSAIIQSLRKGRMGGGGDEVDYDGEGGQEEGVLKGLDGLGLRNREWVDDEKSFLEGGGGDYSSTDDKQLVRMQQRLLKMHQKGDSLQKGNFSRLELKTPKFNLRMGRLGRECFVMVVFGAGEGEMGCCGVNLAVGREGLMMEREGGEGMEGEVRREGKGERKVGIDM